MQTFIHPTEFSGIYPDGWPGFTWLDYDKQANTYHPGDDYNWGSTGNADLGKEVRSTFDGICVYSGDDTILYGKMIVIRHDLSSDVSLFIKNNFGMDTRTIYSLYAHMNERLISVGKVVTTGELIGRVGNTGVTYAHLHFELYRGDLDLANKPWRYYPINWSKEMIIKNWLPPYLLIEKMKATTPVPLTCEQKIAKITQEVTSGNSDGDVRSHIRSILGV